jgi:RNA polymerase sigma-70 factor (ECF subfamily)
MNERSSLTPTTLIRQASSNDQAAWQQLVKRYSRLVYNQAFSVLQRHADAEDIMQQVFADTAKRLAQRPGQAPDASFRGWLRCVTERSIIDFQRVRRNAAAGAIGGTTNAEVLKALAATEDDEPTANIRSATEIEQAAIDAVRTRCRGKTWEIFYAVLCEDRHPKDVAEEFEVTLNEVYLARSRVSRRLREELARLMQESPP